MGAFTFQETKINGLALIEPSYASDDRGYLLKGFQKSLFEHNGIKISIKEVLQSCSQKGVLRGLHIQREHSQAKLIHVLSGAVYDVAVDLRKDSATFGKWESFTLSAENRRMLYIPRGFAHGFLALGENTILNYLLDNEYDSRADGGIRWNDDSIAVSWPLEKVDEIIISPKDRALPTLAEFLEAYGALDSKE